MTIEGACGSYVVSATGKYDYTGVLVILIIITIVLIAAYFICRRRPPRD